MNAVNEDDLFLFEKVVKSYNFEINDDDNNNNKIKRSKDNYMKSSNSKYQPLDVNGDDGNESPIIKKKRSIQIHYH